MAATQTYSSLNAEKEPESARRKDTDGADQTPKPHNPTPARTLPVRALVRVLITGGCGFIGSHQSAHLLEAGHEVCIVDDLSNSSTKSIDHIEAIAGRRPEFRELNVLDTESLATVIDEVKPDATIHLAGYKNVSESTNRVVDYYENNVGGLLSLLRATEGTGMKRLVFSSSGSVYGETSRLPIIEEHPHNPSNPYSSTKSISERILRDLCRSDPTWAVAALRYFNPAGAHPSGLLGESPLGPPSNLLPALMRSAAEGRPVANVYGGDYQTPDGSGIRDYVHVMDVAEIHMRALHHVRNSTGFLALNVGRGSGISVLDLVAAAERATAQRFDVVRKPPRPGDVSALFGDTSEATKVLGPFEYADLDQICVDAWRWHSADVKARPLASGTGTRGLPTIHCAAAAPHRRHPAQVERPKVAVVHEWIDSRAGSEILFEQIAQEFGDADLFALTKSKEPLLELGGRPVQATFLDRIPIGQARRGLTLPLMPLAWKRLERPSYDLVITSTHAFGREFVKPHDGVHCNYVHTPVRYVWSPELDSRADAYGLAGKVARATAKRRDRASAATVTSFAANSNAVANRIAEFYDRGSTVIFPPVDTHYFEAAAQGRRDYLLAASRWIGYKRLDLAIDVAAALDMPLIIAGWGPLEDQYRAAAAERHPNGVELRVSPSRRELRDLMAGASAFLFPANEDFGIIAVEAQAAGTPVVGLAKGGSLDTVLDGRTGALASEQTVEAFVEATERCLLKDLAASDCRAHARTFSTERFRREIRAWTEAAIS